MLWKQNRKLSLVVKWGIVLLLLVLNVGVSLDIGGNGGCISITFDKLPMRLVNRAVICIGEEEYEVSNKDLVCDIVDETVVATCTDLHHTKADRWIKLYCGNVLVRKIQWSDCCGHIFIVYEAGALHWVLPTYDGEGMVLPSDELINKLNAVIKRSRFK